MKVKKQELRFSIFEMLNGVSGAYQTTPTQTLNFNELLEYYNSPENKKLSEAILNAPTPEAKNNLKSKRAYYTPYGIFSTRKNANILDKNNIVSIDIDGLKDKKEAIAVRNKLAENPSTLFALLSTRGIGVKAMMRINSVKDVESFNQLKHVFKPYLKEFLSIEDSKIDEAQFKLSQPCYFSYDEDMYINKDATVLDLEFNYKEPERKLFKPVSIPANASNNIDKYILTVLENKVNNLTPDGARHPKLATVKGLAQLIHYAAHLESEVLETFISAGEQMYNSNEKAKIKGVRKNVFDAWNSSVNKPINNTVLDGIIRDLQKPTPEKKQENKDINYNSKFRYLGQDEKLYSLILKEIKKDKFTIINAPTGSGKTTIVKKIDKDVKDKIVFLAPLRTIVEQQSKDYKTVLGGTTPQEIKIAEKYKLIFSTYSSACRLSSVKDKVLIIDESHLLSDRSNILFSEIQTILGMIKEAKKVIFFSATTNILLKDIFKTNQINITTPAEKIEVQPLFYKENRTDVIIKQLSKKTDAINVLFLNNKTTISDIRKDLVRLGIYKNNEIATFTANLKDVDSEDYQHLIKEQEINNNIKLVLATSKIGEGVNITNEKSFNILFAGSKDVHFFTQSIGRFRNSKQLKVSVLFNESFKVLSGTKIDKSCTYKSLLNEVSKTPILINDFINNSDKEEETNLPNINIDWNERAIVYLNGNKCINSFEILNQIKKIEESRFNFSLWKDAVKEIISNVHFATDVNVNQVKNKDLVKLRKERKKEREELLETVRKHLTNSKAGAVLNEVKNNTKNNILKGFIKYELNSLPLADELGIDEKILFFENFETIENYINNIKILMETFNIGILEAGALFNKDENYKKGKFNLLMKQYVVSELKSKGAKTIKQAKTLQNVKKIEDVFTPFFTDGETVISKVALFFLLRTQLGYRMRAEDLHTIQNKIGSIFDISYNKKTKEFTLKNTVPQNLLCIENKTKLGTSFLSVSATDTDVFSTTNCLRSTKDIKHLKSIENECF